MENLLVHEERKSRILQVPKILNVSESRKDDEDKDMEKKDLEKTSEVTGKDIAPERDKDAPPPGTRESPADEKLQDTPLPENYENPATDEVQQRQRVDESILDETQRSNEALTEKLTEEDDALLDLWKYARISKLSLLEEPMVLEEGLEDLQELPRVINTIALAPHPFIDIKVGDVAGLVALLDTGANCSGISPDLVKRLGCELKDLGKTVQVAVADKDTKLTVLGSTRVELRLENGWMVSQDFLVMDRLSNDIILGMDFLQSLRADLELSNSRLRVKKLNERSQFLPLKKFDGSPYPTVITGSVIESTIEVEPYTEKSVVVKLSRVLEDSKIYFVSEVVNHLGVCVGRGIIDAQDSECVCILVANLTGESVYLHENDVIAELHPLRPEEIYIEELPQVKVMTRAKKGQLNKGLSNEEEPPITEEEKTIMTDIEEEREPEPEERSPRTRQQHRDAVLPPAVKAKVDALLGELLGKDSHLKKAEREQVKDLLMEYHHIFDDRPQYSGPQNDVPYRIMQTDDGPPSYSMPYPMHPERLAALRELVQTYLDAGIITPSNSAWGSPVLLIPKKGGKFRFVVDYRKVNAKTKTLASPLPRMDDSLKMLGTGKLFSSLDLTSGYYQVGLHPEDREISAFTTPFGLYEFVTIPQGIKNAPPAFQNVMNAIAGGLRFESILVYLDDIIVFTVDFDSHLVVLRELFKRLSEKNLKIHPRHNFTSESGFIIRL